VLIIPSSWGSQLGAYNAPSVLELQVLLVQMSPIVLLLLEFLEVLELLEVLLLLELLVLLLELLVMLLELLEWLQRWYFVK
jgi:hypothetical protein